MPSSTRYPLSSNTAKPTAQLAIYITKLSNPNVSAGFLSDFLVEQLEKRFSFGCAMKSAVQQVQRAQIKGIKIQVAGRLNGAEIARSGLAAEGTSAAANVACQCGLQLSDCKHNLWIAGDKGVDISWVG